MTKTKRIVIAGLCVALGVVLPVAVHSIPNAGNILLPMHIPVLLCGLICGPWYGLACGLLTPILSSLISGTFCRIYDLSSQFIVMCDQCGIRFQQF